MATRPVSATTTTKTGLDYSIVNSVTLTSDTPVIVGQAKQSTKSVGIQKLSNRFLKRLLTETGTNPVRPTEGTEFPTLLGSSIGNNEALYVEAKNAVDEATEQLKNEQNNLNEFPDDEQISSASISFFKYSTSEGSLSLNIQVYNLSGESTTLELPSIVIV